MPRKSHMNWGELAPAAAAASSPEETPAVTLSGACNSRDASPPRSEPRAPSCEPTCQARSTASSVWGQEEEEGAAVPHGIAGAGCSGMVQRQ